MQNNNKTLDAHTRRLVAERKLAVKAANLSVGICPPAEVPQPWATISSCCCCDERDSRSTQCCTAQGAPASTNNYSSSMQGNSSWHYPGGGQTIEVSC